MLTLARALGGRPRLLLADELSLGLAPLVVDRLLQAVRRASDAGLGVLLLVKQHVRKVRGFADCVTSCGAAVWCCRAPPPSSRRCSRKSRAFTCPPVGRPKLPRTSTNSVGRAVAPFPKPNNLRKQGG